jgi:transcription initiation factor TFIID subunit 15
MGDIPSQSKMVSAIILSPKPGENIPANKPLTIKMRVANFEMGKFTQPNGTYYTAPQQVSAAGFVQGHVHVTLQDLGGSFTPEQPLDASKFVVFKGVNDMGDGKGLLSASVPNGLPKGFYRVCTMISAQNHQPVLMPVAQRGAQDDCSKFSVGLDDASGKEAPKRRRNQIRARRSSKMAKGMSARKQKYV